MHLIWLRSDLRLHDNTALSAACHRGPTVAVYLLSPKQWLEHDDADCKVDFWLRNLADLSEQLHELNIPLLIRTADHWTQAPEVLHELCTTLKAQTLDFNDEYGVHEQRRDEAVATRLRAAGIGVHQHLDQLLLPPGSVLTQSGGYFKVFGQFRRQCLARLHYSLPSVVRRPSRQAPLQIARDPVPDQVSGFERPSATLREYWPAGEREAHKRLDHFADQALAWYDEERDFPARPGTSQLSAYLAAGVISPRQCLHSAVRHNHGELESGNPGATTWITELIWREFYKHILVGFPRVSMHRAFRPETEALPWRRSQHDLEAWKQGCTGIPIVDAAMRQLTTLGWMHNRLRMVVAMFLSKNLLLDWREGERFFMRHLIDGDLAANNGGWQWSASTGTDSVPYFRVFNPNSQAERFDPQGVFIRRWVPELTDAELKVLHGKKAMDGLFNQGDYPAPIVDLGSSRQRAIAAFRNLSHSSV